MSKKNQKEQITTSLPLNESNNDFNALGGDNLYDNNRRPIIPHTRTHAVSTLDGRVLDDVLDEKAIKANTVRFDFYDEVTGLTQLSRFNAATGSWEQLEGLAGGGGPGAGGGILPGITLSPEPGETEFNRNRSVREDEEVEIRFSWQSANLGQGTVVVAATNRHQNTNWVNREIHRSTVRQGMHLINIGSLPQGTNLIGIWVLDSAGLRSNVEEFTVNSGTLEIRMNTDPNNNEPLDFDADRVFQTNTPITLTFRARSNAPIGTPHQIQITNATTGATTTGILSNLQDSFSLQTHQLGGLPIGDHTLDIRISHSNATFVSNTVRINVIVSDENTIVIGSPTVTGVGHAGGTYTISYRIGMLSTNANPVTQFTVRRYVRGVPEEQLVMAQNGHLTNWTVTLLQEGAEETFGIEAWVPVPAGQTPVHTERRDWTIRVIEPEDSIQPVQNGLTAWFDARIMDNSDRSGVWRSRIGDAVAQLHGFNFDTNGFIGGKLICDGASHVEVDIRPFAQQIPAEGMTIEISYSLENTGNPNARVMDCTHATSPQQQGINISTNMAHMRSTANNPIVGVPHVRTNRIAHTNPDSFNHVAFVWDPMFHGVNEHGVQVHMPMTFIYVDGVVVDATMLGSAESFTHNEKIFLNSFRGEQLFGLTDIRTLRIYNRALNYDDIVQNYISDIIDPEERQKKYEQNFNLQRALPQMNIHHNEYFNEQTNPNPHPIRENLGSATRSTARVDYTDFRMNREVVGEDDEGNEIVIESPVNDPFPNNGFVSIAHQGASSLSFPIRNYRIRFGEHFNIWRNNQRETDIRYEIKPEEFKQREDGKWEAFRRTPWVAHVTDSGPNNNFRYTIEQNGQILEDSPHFDPDGQIAGPPEGAVNIYANAFWEPGEFTSNDLPGTNSEIFDGLNPQQTAQNLARHIRNPMNQPILIPEDARGVEWAIFSNPEFQFRIHWFDENRNQILGSDTAWDASNVSPLFVTPPEGAVYTRTRIRNPISFANGGRLTPEELHLTGFFAMVVTDDIEIPTGPIAPTRPPHPLIILQANAHGNDNGGGGGAHNSFLELYNRSETDIDFDEDPHFVHIAGSLGVWTKVIRLRGTIKARSSFLLISDEGVNGHWRSRAELPQADQIEQFEVDNSGFSMLILRGISELQTGNPFFNHDLINEYVDMVGGGIGVGFETQAATRSRPRPARRRTLNDTNNNAEDFFNVDFRGQWTIPTQGMPDDELYKYWPRSGILGEWDPETGLPEVHPVVNNSDGPPESFKAIKYNSEELDGWSGPRINPKETSNTILDIRKRLKMYLVFDEKPNVDTIFTTWTQSGDQKIALNGRQFWQNLNGKTAPNYRWNPKADFMDSSMINEPFLSALLNGQDVHGNPYPHQRRIYSKDVPGIAWGNSLNKEGRQDIVHYHYCGFGSGGQNTNGRNWHLTTKTDYDYLMAPNITAYPMNVILNGIPQGIYNMNTDKNDAVQYGLYDYNPDEVPVVENEPVWGVHNGSNWGTNTRTTTFNRVLSFEGLENSAALSTTFRTWQPDRMPDGTLKEFVSGDGEIDEATQTRNGHNQFPDAWSYYGQGWELRYASPTGNGGADGENMAHPDTRRAYDFFIDLIEWTNAASSTQFINTINSGVRWVNIPNNDRSLMLGTGIERMQGNQLQERRPVFDKEYLLKFYLMQQVFLMVDNGAKNTFFNTWDGITWYPQFWDVDTAMGIRNSGHLNVPVDAMPGFGRHWYDVPDDWEGTPEEWRQGGWKTVVPEADELPDDWGGIFDDQDLGRPIFNASFSILWERVRVEFHEDLREAYREMRVAGGAFDTTHILNHIMDFNQQMSEIDFNRNLREKYIRHGETWISRFHGTRLNHMLWLFRNRLIWLDTFYEDWLRYSNYETGGGGGNSLIRTGGNRHPDMTDLAPHEVPRFFDLEVTATCLMFINVGGGDQTDATTYLTRCNLEDNEPREDKPWRGTRIWLPNTGYDQEIQFYNPDLIRGLGDISWTNAQDLGVFNNMLEIKLIGGNLLTGTYSAHFPRLQSMNFRNTGTISGDVDISMLRMLSYVDLRGTATTQGQSLNVIFHSHLGSATALREIYLPASMNLLALNGQTGLRVLGIPFTLRTPEGYNSFALTDNAAPVVNTYSNLSTLSIINCPNIEQIGVNEGNVPVWPGRNLIALSRVNNLTIRDSLSPAFRHLDFSNMRRLTELTLTDLRHVEELWFNDMGSIRNTSTGVEANTATEVVSGTVQNLTFPMLRTTEFGNLTNCRKVKINTHSFNPNIANQTLGRAEFPENFILDLRALTGLETIECNDGVVGLDTIRIPNSVRHIDFSIFPGMQELTRPASVRNITTTTSTTSGMNLQGTIINRMDLASLTSINNITNAYLVPLNEPILFNHNRNVGNFIQVSGTIDLTKYTGNSIDFLFRGINEVETNLNIVTPPVMSSITSAVETFAHSIFNVNKRSDIWDALPNIQNATRMFMGSNIVTGLRMDITHRLISTADSMYQDCTSLITAPTLPDSLRQAGAMFQGCTSLQNPPELPNGIEGVVNMFSGCSMLQRTPNMPNSISNTSGMFRDCLQLNSVAEFSSNMTNASDMFRNCRNLINIVHPLPDTTSDNPGLLIATTMFRDCRRLAITPELPNSIVNANEMFRSCHSILFAQEVPDSLINANNMYFDCYRLSTAPDDYKNIVNASGMFAHCDALINATAPIPDTVTDMSMMFAATNLINGPTRIGNSVRNMDSAYRETNIETFTLAIPNSVNSMESTFQGCTELRTGPSSFSNVENLALTFAGCVNLQNTPDALPTQTTDARGLYMGCESINRSPALYTATTLNNITHIFSNNSVALNYFLLGLNEERESMPSFVRLETERLRITEVPAHPTSDIRIPNTVMNASFAFYNCNRLQILPNFPLSLSGVGADSMYSGCSVATTGPSTIPLGLSSFNNVFEGCNALTTGIESFPNGIISANQAFRNCHNISAVPRNIPNGIQNCEEMFLNCRRITRAATSLPNSVINTSRMFAGCENLTTDVVNSIGVNVVNVTGMYENCHRLTSVPTAYAAQATTTNSMFRNCRALNTTVNLSNASFVINMDSMYDGCSSLTHHPDGHWPPLIREANALFRNTAISEVRFPMQLSGGSSTISMYEGTRITNILNQATTQANALAVVLPNASRMFANCLQLEEVPLIPANIINASEFFAGCTNLRIVNGIPAATGPNVTVAGFFKGCSSLHTVNNLNFMAISSNTDADMPSNFWTGCTSLANVTFTAGDVGTIAFDFELNVSENITTATLNSLTNALIHPSHDLGRGNVVNVVVPVAVTNLPVSEAMAARGWRLNGTTMLQLDSE